MPRPRRSSRPRAAAPTCAVAPSTLPWKDGTGLAAHAHHGSGLERHVDVGVEQALGRGIRLSRVECAQRPPHVAARVRRLAQRRQGEEVAGTEVDGRLGTGGRRAPRRLEELAVRVAERDRAGDGALRVDQGDRRVLGQVVREGDEAIDDGGQERLHALDRDALGHLLEHAGEPGEVGLEVAGALAHGLREEQLAAGEERDLAHLAGKRALIGDREGADLIDLVAEELDAAGVSGRRGEDVEDAASDGELAAARDHVDAVIGQLDKTQRHLAQVVTASADGQLDGRNVGEPGGQRLDGAAHRCRDHQRCRGIPSRNAPEHFEPGADDLGTRAEAFVRQRLPGGEMQHLGAGEELAESGSERLRAAARRRDQQHDGRLACGSAAFDERREQRSTQPFDEREVGVDRGGGHRVPERLCLLEGAHDPGNCHRTSLSAGPDTGRGRVTTRAAPRMNA